MINEPEAEQPTAALLRRTKQSYVPLICVPAVLHLTEQRQRRYVVRSPVG